MEVLGYFSYIKLRVVIETFDIAIGACWNIDALNAGRGFTSKIILSACALKDMPTSDQTVNHVAFAACIACPLAMSASIG